MSNPTADPVAYPTATCPECGRVVLLERQIDGLGRPREDRPLRFTYHAGSRWGRPCRGGGQTHLGDEP